MRRCLLLPVQDKVGDSISYRVFTKLEKYLVESDWCYYRPNSEIINILSSYKNNIDTHLKNPQVLKIIADKTSAGSLIKVNIDFLNKGAEVKIKILGRNGDDVYFSEKTHLSKIDIDLISQAVINWLEQYKAIIPYDGQVLGVLGNNFTQDIGSQSGVSKGIDVKIVRPIRKKKHPLLKEIVDWDVDIIGKAKVIFTNVSQSQAKVYQYEGKKRVAIGDWVVLEKAKESVVKQPVNDISSYEFGKLGNLGLYFNLGNGSTTVLTNSSTTKKIGGMLFGVDLKGETWVTRKYFVALDIGKRVGSFKQKEGSLTNSSNSASFSTFKFVGAFKYLPLGFFYGPQIDFMVGYGKYGYGLDTQTTDGFTETSFKGFLLGVKGGVPVKRSFHVHLMIDFIVGSKYSEQVNLYGEADSVSSYSFEVGLKYKYKTNMTLDAIFSSVSNKAEFRNPTQELSYSESNIKLGTTFTF